jgi:nucleotidyltransferase substrate binding protein (TIGR01987 family)
MELTNKNLERKYENTFLAIKNVEKEIEKYHRHVSRKENFTESDFEDLVVTHRNSVIKSFELAIDILWKYLKLYGEVVGGMTFENNSPKAIVRVCHQTKIVDELEAEKLIIMIEGRNNTSHIYKEEIAQQIFCSIEKYYKVMKNIVDRLNPSVEM